MFYIKINHGDYISYRTYNGMNKSTVVHLIEEKFKDYEFIEKNEFDAEMAKLFTEEINNGN